MSDRTNEQYKNELTKEANKYGGTGFVGNFVSGMLGHNLSWTAAVSKEFANAARWWGGGDNAISKFFDENAAMGKGGAERHEHLQEELQRTGLSGFGGKVASFMGSLVDPLILFGAVKGVQVAGKLALKGGKFSKIFSRGNKANKTNKVNKTNKANKANKSNKTNKNNKNKTNKNNKSNSKWRKRLSKVGLIGSILSNFLGGDKNTNNTSISKISKIPNNSKTKSSENKLIWTPYNKRKFTYKAGYFVKHKIINKIFNIEQEYVERRLFELNEIHSRISQIYQDYLNQQAINHLYDVRYNNKSTKFKISSGLGIANTNNDESIWKKMLGAALLGGSLFGGKNKKNKKDNKNKNKNKSKKPSNRFKRFRSNTSKFFKDISKNIRSSGSKIANNAIKDIKNVRKSFSFSNLKNILKFGGKLGLGLGKFSILTPTEMGNGEIKLSQKDIDDIKKLKSNSNKNNLNQDNSKTNNKVSDNQKINDLTDKNDKSKPDKPNNSTKPDNTKTLETKIKPDTNIKNIDVNIPNKNVVASVDDFGKAVPDPDLQAAMDESNKIGKELEAKELEHQKKMKEIQKLEDELKKARANTKWYSLDNAKLLAKEGALKTARLGLEATNWVSSKATKAKEFAKATYNTSIKITNKIVEAKKIVPDTLKTFFSKSSGGLKTASKVLKRIPLVGSLLGPAFAIIDIASSNSNIQTKNAIGRGIGSGIGGVLGAMLGVGWLSWLTAPLGAFAGEWLGEQLSYFGLEPKDFIPYDYVDSSLEEKQRGIALMWNALAGEMPGWVDGAYGDIIRYAIETGEGINDFSAVDFLFRNVAGAINNAVENIAGMDLNNNGAIGRYITGFNSSFIGNPGQAAIVKAVLKYMDIAELSELEKYALLALIRTESGGGKSTNENTNWSWERACQIWPTTKPGTRGYRLRQVGESVWKTLTPDQKADIIYADLGGAKYKGRGVVQLTGIGNYKDVQKVMSGWGLGFDIINNPELVASDPNVAAASAVAWWCSSYRHKALKNAAESVDLHKIRYICAGGYDKSGGLEKFINYYAELRQNGLPTESSIDEAVKGDVSQKGLDVDNVDDVLEGAGAAVGGGHPKALKAAAWALAHADRYHGVFKSKTEGNMHAGGNCALAVSEALWFGGKIGDHRTTGHAQYKHNEFIKIGLTYIGKGDDPNYHPQVGDISLSKYGSYGHNAIFVKNRWVSDYIPNTTWDMNRDYFGSGSARGKNTQIYRLSSNDNYIDGSYTAGDNSAAHGAAGNENNDNKTVVVIQKEYINNTYIES